MRTQASHDPGVALELEDIARSHLRRSLALGALLGELSRSTMLQVDGSGPA